MQLKAEKSTEEVKLQAIDLEIENCTLTDDKENKPCTFQLNKNKEELVIQLPFPCSGNIELSLSYTGKINDQMAGFYRSSYNTPQGIKYIAVTQFEESDARRVFPCMDHPVYKAGFTVELIVDDKIIALSNEDIHDEEKLPGGKKRIQFKKTPKMSTYLVFFGIGDFEKKQHTKDPRVTVYTVPGKIDYSGYGLDFGKKALSFCESYFNIPYPLTKMDLIAVPDFAFGAMENWGAVTFRENLLLYYSGITSRKGERRICEVIAHEIVHMWFGNLVTPADWKYLWLNESFATFFGFGIVDHFNPDWDIWDQFIYEETVPALERDALTDTFAIEIPGGEHVVINSSTSPIIYSKGGSVLRQMKEYIGEDTFQEGLVHYLETYAYGNTSSAEFFKAFEEKSDIPITTLMENWITQPGFPLVTVNRNQNSLVYSQQRFTYLPYPKDKPEFHVQTWHIPLTVCLYYKDREPEVVRVLLKDKEEKMEINGHFSHYKINPDHTGFYRVYYKDNKNVTHLGKMITDKTLSPKNRWGCENDMYALAQSCSIPFKEYLSFLSVYNKEDAYLPVMSITKHLFYSYFILSGEWTNTIKKTGCMILESALDSIGFLPEEGENFTKTVLRDQILYDAYFYGSDKIEAFCSNQFTSFSRGNHVHPDILKSVMMAGAGMKPDEAWDVLINRLEMTQSEHDRLNILYGISCFSQEDIVRKTLTYILEKVPSRNKYIPLARMALNPYAVPHLWDWYIANLKELEKFHPVHYERILTWIIPFCGLGREDEIRAFFKEYTAAKDLAAQAISSALERLTIYERMRKENVFSL